MRASKAGTTSSPGHSSSGSNAAIVFLWFAAAARGAIGDLRPCCLREAADALIGFELRDVRHGDKLLANVIRSVRAESRVSGTTFEVTDAELAAADVYERGDAYTRIQASLASGGEAWVYVEAASIS